MSSAEHPVPAQPLPYPYQAPAQAMSASAFGPVFKAIAWFIVLALLVWFWRLDMAWLSRQGAWCGVVWAMLCFIVWHIQRSRIQLDHEAIEQSWMWQRRVALRELAYVKIMRIRGLEHLVAPRIYVRNLGGTFTFFYCHDRAMLEEFTRLAQALRQHEQRV
ncbi:hypothetical protein B9Z38_15485 [Limnohabitans sp. MMS-10A-160]|uniref:hypothetical protein n=1 Tax=Limnohabitans sp. MMS-10A-192 TaxID=1835769 RepID=UPI000D344558|nr:hypothetical protein [Limnohabitans sp. MMS-10A-192]PUE18553.1 hypothetical protein B9Z43_12220 [Limnohabitans sp. MMS-10A-192]PUE22752.1 hypothetical protein B9Z38_15485 [Limnohabitans sp. MMS-10A-160]